MKQILFRKRNIILLLIPLGILFTSLAKRNAYIAEEVFAAGLYKILSQGMGLLTGWVPFSLMEVIIIAGPITVLVLIIRQIIRVVKVKHPVYDMAQSYRATMAVKSVGEQRFLLLMTMLQNLLCLVAVIFFGYVLLCGVNYHRYPVAYHLGLTVENSSVEELEGLYVELADTATELRNKLTTENERGVYVLPFSERELGKKAKKAYEALAEDYPVFGGIYPAPKHVFFSRLMSYTEITGVFTPWTMEANVNIDISPYSIGATMCHELAHLRGFMREDEANYISYCACMVSDSVDLQYSGIMLALIHTGNALYRQDAERYYVVYREHISEAVSRDLIANNEYWDQFEKPVAGDTSVADIAEKVNDTYLKWNDQSDGTKSYGRMVDLLLAEYKQRHGLANER
ncbi:MAG: DUF3810 domain-containing protein [Lachnospiraceae bacterium]|nr:DUF3810 domain-containing protein [Lachnospiraceae bacterium]